MGQLVTPAPPLGRVRGRRRWGTCRVGRGPGVGGEGRPRGQGCAGVRSTGCLPPFQSFHTWEDPVKGGPDPHPQFRGHLGTQGPPSRLPNLLVELETRAPPPPTLTLTLQPASHPLHQGHKLWMIFLLSVINKLTTGVDLPARRQQGGRVGGSPHVKPTLTPWTRGCDGARPPRGSQGPSARSPHGTESSRVLGRPRRQGQASEGRTATGPSSSS